FTHCGLRKSEEEAAHNLRHFGSRGASTHGDEHTFAVLTNFAIRCIAFMNSKKFLSALGTTLFLSTSIVQISLSTMFHVSD
ncbi:hypothetical protein PMAYCL1PPCAC_19613, partial [Pristionchus mayeri]